MLLLLLTELEEPFLNSVFLPEAKLFAGESLNFDSESLLRILPLSESLAVVSEPFLDFDSELLLLLPERLLPSLLFLQDCAECGLPGDSPLRLRVCVGAGLCLPPPGGFGAA